jgi:hypothetical protein
LGGLTRGIRDRQTSNMPIRRSIALVACAGTLLVTGCADRSASGLPAGDVAPQGVREAAEPDPAEPLAAGATLAVHSGSPGATIDARVLGANFGAWFDITQSGIAQTLTNGGFTAARWPGGSASDQFHWQTNTLCNGGYFNSNSTFDNFINDVAQPAKLDVAVTLDYGSNSACNAGGDPTEAAAWVGYSNVTHNYGVKYWTVGNEVYGGWEYDLHSKPHDAATYASAVANGYYPDIKAVDPTSQVGVVVQPGWSPAWDPIVLSQAQYDFVEFHYYAQAPGQESDSYLISQAPQALTASIQAVQQDLAAAGHGSTPIYVGELGSVYSNPGKQSTSITQALYAGQVLGELMNDGVFRATWWLAYGGCSDPSSGNFSKSLYGFQNFGGYMIFSDGTPEYGCPNATEVPRGTPLPTVRAYQLMSQVAVSGEHVLGTALGGSSKANVRAYAMTHGSGYGVVLFNLDKSATIPVSVSIDGLAKGSKLVTTTYGKAQYAKSKDNIWAAPASKTTGKWNGPFTVKLPAWSMTVVLASP